MGNSDSSQHMGVMPEPLQSPKKKKKPIYYQINQSSNNEDRIKVNRQKETEQIDRYSGTIDDPSILDQTMPQSLSDEEEVYEFTLKSVQTEKV